MSGLVLLIVFLLIVSCVCLMTLSDNDLLSESGGFLGIILTIIFIIMLVAIPVSRQDSRSNLMSIEQAKVLIESTRAKTGTELERVELTKQIMELNQKISNWKVKGQKWYQNKWYYDPKCKDVPFLE